MLCPPFVNGRQQTDDVGLSEFQVVAEWFHIEGGSLIPMDEYNQLLLEIFIIGNSSLVAAFAHFDQSIVFLEGIDEERVLTCGCWHLFNDEAMNSMML